MSADRTGRRAKRGGVIDALTRERPSQLVDFLVGAFFLILFCTWVLARISAILAVAVFVLVTVAYLVGLANRERSRRRRERPLSRRAG